VCRVGRKGVLRECFEKFIWTNRFVINDTNHTRSSHLVKRLQYSVRDGTCKVLASATSPKHLGVESFLNIILYAMFNILHIMYT